MDFDIQTFDMPDFGMMTKADKLKLDGINSSTYLTTAEAATTYATKAEMREYVRQLVESDTGYVALNGNGSEVGVIPALIQKEDPNLQVMYNSEAVGDSVIMYGRGSGAPTYFDVTYSGNGVVTVSDTGDYFCYDSTTKKIELDDHNSFLNNEGNTTTITVNLASDGTYDTATKVFTVISMGSYVPTPDLPTVDP